MRKAPTPSTVNGAFQDHHQRDDFTPNAQKIGSREKEFATLQARAAIKGHTLQKLGSGYLLSRWGHVRHFIDLDTAEAMIQRIEGGPR